MINTLFVLLISCTLIRSNKTLEAKVVGVHKVDDIIHYSYSVFLAVEDIQKENFICGASVVNQRIVLTAAHCLTCNNRCMSIIAYVGSTIKKNGQRIPVRAYIKHEKYNPNLVDNDIGIALLRTPLKLGKFVSRVALMRKPPFEDVAKVAGWGLTDEIKYVKTKYLHAADQKVIPKEQCLKIIIGRLPEGTFCGGHSDSNQYPSEGDSGSPLIIKNYIQIGIVSFKKPYVSRSIVVYTDVAYFYDWIKSNSVYIYCRGRKNVIHL